MCGKTTFPPVAASLPVNDQSDDNRHILPSENTVRKKLLATLLDLGKKGVIVVSDHDGSLPAS
jgi:hypothetical protein